MAQSGSVANTQTLHHVKSCLGSNPATCLVSRKFDLTLTLTVVRTLTTIRVKVRVRVLVTVAVPGLVNRMVPGLLDLTLILTLTLTLLGGPASLAFSLVLSPLSY